MSVKWVSSDCEYANTGKRTHTRLYISIANPPVIGLLMALIEEDYMYNVTQHSLHTVVAN